MDEGTDMNRGPDGQPDQRLNVSLNEEEYDYDGEGDFGDDNILDDENPNDKTLPISGRVPRLEKLKKDKLTPRFSEK